MTYRNLTHWTPINEALNLPTTKRSCIFSLNKVRPYFEIIENFYQIFGEKWVLVCLGLERRSMGEGGVNFLDILMPWDSKQNHHHDFIIYVQILSVAVWYEDMNQSSWNFYKLWECIRTWICACFSFREDQLSSFWYIHNLRNLWHPPKMNIKNGARKLVWV